MGARVRSTDAVMSNGSGVRTDVGSRPEDAPPAATAQRFDPRTRVLLEGPITSTLLRLATPNGLVMLIEASVGLHPDVFRRQAPYRWAGRRGPCLPRTD